MARTVQGIRPRMQDGDVVPEGLVVLVAVGGEALQIVLEEERSTKVGLLRCTAMYQGSTMTR